MAEWLLERPLTFLHTCMHMPDPFLMLCCSWGEGGYFRMSMEPGSVGPCQIYAVSGRFIMCCACQLISFGLVGEHSFAPIFLRAPSGSIDCCPHVSSFLLPYSTGGTTQLLSPSLAHNSRLSAPAQVQAPPQAPSRLLCQLLPLSQQVRRRGAAITS